MIWCVRTLALAGAVCCSSAFADGDELVGLELWGGRKAHLAVVNPALGEDPDRVISLSGEWETWINEELSRRHAWAGLGFYRGEGKFHRLVRIPGAWEADGVGEPGMSVPWNVTGDNSRKRIRHLHMGALNYRRRVTIPESWKGLRVWLKVGAIGGVGWCYVNGNNVAIVDNYCGTYKYEITEFVTPGQEAVIGIQASNKFPSRKGEMRSAHRWGGVFRDVELEATPSVFIDDAWVRGDFDLRNAQVKVEMAGGGGQRKGPFSLRATVDGETAQIPLSTSTSSLHLEVPLRNFRPWSPEHPNLYTAVVELVENGQVIQVRRERFGVRKLEVRGKEFYLNGAPYYFRGFGDDHVNPITGISPPDRKVHRERFLKAKAAGFNFVRLHTHCDWPEYFEAADEAGILVQPELPYYNDQPCEEFASDPIRDATELWRNYRRYPSFAVYSLGNEGSFGDRLDRQMHRYIKKMDPDRLKINQDCHLQNVNPPDRADYTGGPIDMWVRGSFDPDRPFVTHEYMNLGAKQDSRLEPQFTGTWLPPVTRRDRAEWLAKSGLGMEWGDRLQDSQHALQRTYQKLGIECARTDPYCDGFCFWTIADVVVANSGTYSAQGVFDPFWNPKRCGNGYADVRVFNSPVGVFADMGVSNRVFTAGDRADVEFRLANYGDGTISGAELRWRMTAGAEVLAEGTLPIGDQPVGAVRVVARADVGMPSVRKPTAATFRAEVVDADGRSVTANHWPCWLFPRRGVRDGRFIAVSPALAKPLAGLYSGLLPADRAAEAEVVIAECGSPLAAEALARGQRVITLDGCEGPTNVKPGWWFFGDQVGTAFLEHPALAGLPHGGFLDELFFRILKKGRELPIPGVAEGGLIAVGEGGRKCFAYLAETRCGGGSALMAFGLDVLGGTPEGTSLLDGMVDYVRSDAFAPARPRELTVMTWNTEHYGWWNRSAAECALIESNMFAVVRAVDPDVLLVQETYGSFDRFRAALPDREARLLGACNSVYSRFPIAAVHDTYRDRSLYGCTNGYDYAGGNGPFHFSAVELDVGGRRIRVCPIALNWQPYASNLPADLDAAGLLAAEAGPQPNGGTPRPRQMADILGSIRDLLAEADRIPIVIGGDFNSHSHLDWAETTADRFGHGGRVVPWPVSRTMAEAGFTDTYRVLHPDPISSYGTTYMRTNPSDPKTAIYARMDYIYSKGKGLRPVKSEAVNGAYHRPFVFRGESYTCFPSDHGFVLTTFVLE